MRVLFLIFAVQLCVLLAGARSKSGECYRPLISFDCHHLSHNNLNVANCVDRMRKSMLSI